MVKISFVCARTTYFILLVDIWFGSHSNAIEMGKEKFYRDTAVVRNEQKSSKKKRIGKMAAIRSRTKDFLSR